MKRFNYKGHRVEVFEGYDGDQVFIYKGEQKVYSARTNRGEGVARVYEKLG